MTWAITKEQAHELINAAFAVATSPSVAAYQKGNATHGVYRNRMRRLLDALAELPLNDGARADVELRQRAYDNAEAKNAAWRARSEAEAELRRQQRQEVEG